MQNILIVRYGTLGDTIFASAFLRELRNALPDAKIDYLADKITQGVLKYCPYIDNIIEKEGKWEKIIYYINIFKKYDTIYFLKNDSFLTICAGLAGTKKRIGFNILRNHFLNKKAPYTEKQNEIDCYLELLQISGIEPKSNHTEVWINKEEEDKIKNFLSETKNKKVIIQGFSRFSYKNWLKDYWLEVLKYLSNEKRMQIYFTGSKADFEVYENLSKELENLKIKPINISGKYSISESFAIIKNADYFIGIDSGLIHAAAALNIPSILIMGPTSLERWAPKNKNCTIISKSNEFACAPCHMQKGANRKCNNKTPECMKALTPDIVIKEIETKFH